MPSFWYYLYFFMYFFISAYSIQSNFSSVSRNPSLYNLLDQISMYNIDVHTSMYYRSRYSLTNVFLKWDSSHTFSCIAGPSLKISCTYPGFSWWLCCYHVEIMTWSVPQYSSPWTFALSCLSFSAAVPHITPKSWKTNTAPCTVDSWVIVMIL